MERWALQKRGGSQSSGAGAAWIDIDRTFDPAYAASLGVALAPLVVVMPEFIEEAFEWRPSWLPQQAVSLLIVDPAAALVPAVNQDAAMGTSGARLRGRVLASGLRN